MLVKRPKSRTKGEAKPDHRVLAEQRFQEVRRVGRPPGARNKLSEAFIGDLHDIWSENGPAILRRMLVDEPAKLAELVARLIPKEFQVSVQQQPAAIDPEEWELLVGIAKTMREVAPDASLPEIETALRSAFAKPVLEHNQSVILCDTYLLAKVEHGYGDHRLREGEHPGSAFDRPA